MIMLNILNSQVGMLAQKSCLFVFKPFVDQHQTIIWFKGPVDQKKLSNQGCYTYEQYRNLSPSIWIQLCQLSTSPITMD